MAHVRKETHRSGQVTLDVNGNGTITIYPDPYWDEWIVTRVPVRTNQPAGSFPVPSANVWLNDPLVPDNHHGGTRDGDLDVGTGRVPVGSDDVLLVVFTGGRAGDIAYATAWGFYTRQTGWPG